MRFRPYSPVTAFAMAVTLSVCSAATAQEATVYYAPPPPPPPTVYYAPPPPPARPAPAAPVAPNIATSPDGSVSVSRTPEQGVDVHAQTGAGTVHAYSCNRVDVDPRGQSAAPPWPAPPPGAYGTPPPPCPAAYAAPYPAYPYPYPYYAPPSYLPYPRAVDVAPRKTKKKSRYAPDPARKGALIASSLVFGLGTVAAGTAYVASLADDLDCDWDGSCHAQEPSKAALYTMGGILTFTPSIPRLVVGSIWGSLLYTGLRGGSFALGVFVDWDDDTYMLPVTFALIAPLTLGIVDLATTPHREQLQDKKARSYSAFELRGLGPTAIMDKAGNPAPAFGAMGTF
jgi:hypothetical protein